MTDRPMNDATRNQVAAADPLASTWLTANAGSGKTRVLTDRVARLLLRGTPPERILCLTYTKAAATEMQNRLLRRLGEWAMLPESDLRAALAALGEAGTADLTEARRLFALAIETPGGLKVQTIHSFCAALLRRFPLEAGVPLGFAELDERSASVLRAEIIEEMAEAGDPAIDDLTALHSGHELNRFLAGLSAAAHTKPPDQAALWASHGLAAAQTEDALLAQVFDGGERDLFGALIPQLAQSGTNDQRAATRLKRGDWSAPGPVELSILVDVLLTGKDAKEPFTAKIGTFPTKGLRNGPSAGLMPDLDDLMLRVQDAHTTLLALAAAKRSLTLHRFAHQFTHRYEARKLDHGWLDFDDLIRRAAGLLSESSMAQWVLWRLDGGIDHILVDEAQDTSPEQWRVIERLTDEFTSGSGAVPRDRTLFVVGDPKQSIYSFQGADTAVFEAMRDQFDRDFAQAQAPMARRELLHSFRSSPAILRLVDAVFQGETALERGGDAHHIAFHQALPGRIDIWPPVAAPEPAEPGEWWVPQDRPVPPSAQTLLANAVAAQIAAIHGTPFHDIREGRVRPLRFGDVLILVQRRSALFDEIIRACKSAGLPIAGADRLKLAAELAVRDIRAVLACVDTPEDDLSLAAALRSPLFGLDEDALFRLAHGRRKREFLWERLRQSDHADAVAILTDLMNLSGYLRPYDLISRLLIRHGGRDRLLARLGQEAEDGIAELLSQALSYEGVETPSLTGFLVWLSGDDIEVRRQVGSGDEDLIRVMTVHGAKGLESPVVILPDTAKPKASPAPQTIALPDGPVVWRGSKGQRPAAIEDAVSDEQARLEEERRRLLYVGITRAESWLIVAAAGETGAGMDSWHALIAEGAGRAGLDSRTVPIEGIGTATRFDFGDWPDGQPLDGPATNRAGAGPTALPDWVRIRPQRPPHPAQPIAATALGGAKVVAGAPVEDADPQAAMLRGTRLHLLLEHLPGSDPADWPALARTALSGAEGGLPGADELADLLAEAGAVITAPDLAQVMAPEPGDTVLAEIDLTASLDWVGPLHGTVDRLIIGPDRVLAVDYKSNSDVPATPDAVPAGILRQMAAYRDALRLIYPGRRVAAAVLWTASRSLMDLPDAVLDQARAALDPQALRP
ncbi:double-strand break repair helicase AddA [Paracoccus sp. M683]|uniref:double-strand break repair helicase AddA n=1 Tax=Paracoccus sp. M683 TaxID=2594268 RepID=UPI00117F4263|nr:double-strand break repair helicase AddA [Paracoccus sp. M683]TRW98842.1 double-strand break repair helicase AddA [Paracoccus sp. M683]